MNIGSPTSPRLPRSKSLQGKMRLIGVSLAALLIGFGVTSGYLLNLKDLSNGSEVTQKSTASSIKNERADTAEPSAQIPVLSETSLKLDESRQYGDKYASGILPVGDGKYTTDAPKVGYIYSCRPPQDGAPGAGSRGPWFMNGNTQYDSGKKTAVSGSVSWKSSYAINSTNGTRTIMTNDVPNSHTTGVFPIRSSDAAYAYDRNPNAIAEQSLEYTLPATPTPGSPSCMGGEVGIMTTGVALFTAFDAGGRDAGAWEAQDDCDGHPQKSGEYHYHTLSSCIKITDVKTVIGYALDGFPITGPRVSEGNTLTTKDLDECHGITSAIQLDGRRVVSYHYVMTQDFPYSVSCFRAKPIQPPGLKL